MNPIDTWVDTDEIRRLAERLISPDRQFQPKIQESGFDESFVGFAETRATASSPNALMAAPPLARTPAPDSTESTQIRTTSGAEISAKTPDTFAKLAKWLHQDCGASAVFALNLEGKILHDEGCAHLHFAARGIALNWKLRDTVKPVRLLINANSYLELIPAHHPQQGRIILGVIVSQPINPSTLNRIREKTA